MFGLGAGEILIILVIALLFIGPKKLPELAKNLGKGIRDFQNAIKGISDEDERSTYTPPPVENESEIKKRDHLHGEDNGDDIIATTASQKNEDEEIEEKEVKKDS